MATTPRPLDWKPATLITTDAQDAVKSVQFEDGNAEIIYKKNKEKAYKSATITQGHWESMALGYEIFPYVEKLKNIEATQAIPEEVYSLVLRLSNRPILYKKNYTTGVETEQILNCIT